MSSQEDQESEGEIYITDEGFVKRKRPKPMYPPPPPSGHCAMPGAYSAFTVPYSCTVPGHYYPPFPYSPSVTRTPYNPFPPGPTPYKYPQHPTALYNTYPNYSQGMQPIPNYVPPCYPVNPETQPPKAPPPPVQLHRYLDYYGEVPPRIVWDIIHPPQRAKILDKNNEDRLKKVDLGLPAFKESTTLKNSTVELTTLSDVASSMLEAWGPILLRKARPTILDLLTAIYGYWAQPLTSDDVLGICQASENIERLKKAREERAKDGCEFEAVAMQGFKRSDVLGSHRRFWGLRIHMDGFSSDGTCLLAVAVAPGPTPKDYWKW